MCYVVTLDSRSIVHRCNQPSARWKLRIDSRFDTGRRSECRFGTRSGEKWGHVRDKLSRKTFPEHPWMASVDNHTFRSGRHHSHYLFSNNKYLELPYNQPSIEAMNPTVTAADSRNKEPKQEPFLLERLGGQRTTISASLSRRVNCPLNNACANIHLLLFTTLFFVTNQRYWLRPSIYFMIVWLPMNTWPNSLLVFQWIDWKSIKKSS